MLHVIPLEPAAGDSLIKAVRFTPGRPLTFGTWRELPVIAIGPRGGKIVGYRRGNIPIYAGSRRAKALAQTFQEVERVSKKNIPDMLTPYESQQYAILVKNWLNAQESVGGAVVLMDVMPHQSIVFPHDHGVKTDSSAADDFLAMQGLVGKGPAGDVFSLKEILALMKNKPAPAPPPEEQAVMAAESASGQAAEPIFPNLAKLKEVPAGEAAGSHGNKLFVDEHGEKWLFKPKDPVISRAEIAATMIARKVLGDRIQAAKMVEIKGKEGVLLSWLKGKLLPSSDHSHPDLSTFKDPAVFEQFVQHHVVDWLISNHDGHAGNWLLRSKEGQAQDLCGIDKGQAWRFFGEDSLSTSYSPNHSVPIYNRIWKAWEQGTYPNLPRTTVAVMLAKAIDRVDQAITPDQLAAMVGPYALAYTQKYGGDPTKLIEKMKARLAGLRQDFSAFLSEITGDKVELLPATPKKAPQEPEKVPPPPPKAATPPIATPAPAQVAPAKEKAPAGPFQPIPKGNFKLTAQGKAPSKAAVWPKGYPGPGTAMEIIYKQQFYKVEFAEGTGGKPFITVTYPDKTSKSFSSPNAAGDSLYLWHNKLSLDMTATEKKAKKMGASAKVTLGIGKFTPEELGMGEPGAASAPPAVLEDKGVVAPGAESVPLGTLLANEVGKHGILTKPELIPQVLKDFAEAHQHDTAQGQKSLLPPGKVFAYLVGEEWWFATPWAESYAPGESYWRYGLFKLNDDGSVTHAKNNGVALFEGGLSKFVVKEWESKFAPPGEKHEGGPSPDNWETMPDEDASIGWTKYLTKTLSPHLLGPGASIHAIYKDGTKHTFVNFGNGVWAVYTNGKYQGGETTAFVDVLLKNEGPEYSFVGQVEKMPPHSPTLQSSAAVGAPPEPVLPATAEVPPSTSEHHPGLLAEGTTISVTKPFKMTPESTETMDVPASLTAKGGLYYLEFKIPGATVKHSFKTLTAAALGLQAAQEGYASLAEYLQAKGKPEKLPTWQAWGINVETEAPEAVAAELEEHAPKKELPMWEHTFELTEKHSTPEFYVSAKPMSIIKLGTVETETGTKLHYLMRRVVGQNWSHYLAGEMVDSLSSQEALTFVKAWQKVHPNDVVTGHAAPDTYMGDPVEIPGYAAKATTLLSPEWMNNLEAGSEVWVKEHPGFAPKQFEKLGSGSWVQHPTETTWTTQEIFDDVKVKNPEELALFITGYKKTPAPPVEAKEPEQTVTPEVPGKLTSEQATAYKNKIEEWIHTNTKFSTSWVIVKNTVGGEPAVYFQGTEADVYLQEHGLTQISGTYDFKLKDVLALMATGKAAPVQEAPPPKLPTSGKKAKANKHLSYLDPDVLGVDNPAVSKWKAIAATQEEKPSNWPSWMPPPGLPIEVTSGGTSAWVMALPHFGNDRVKFAVVTEDGGYLVSKAYKATSAALALKRIFWRMKQHGVLPGSHDLDSPVYQAAFSVAKAKKLCGLDKAVWAPGETWQSVMSGSGVSGVPTINDVAPGKDTSTATPAEKKTEVKANWQKMTILTAKVGPAEQYGSKLKLKQANKLGYMNIIMDAGPESVAKLDELMEALGLVGSSIQKPGHPSEMYGGALYTVSATKLAEEMVLETTWVDAKSAEQGKPTPDTSGQLPLEVKPPKYDPAKFAAMKAAAAEKAAKAKELHAWAKQYPMVTKTSQQLALAHFQKHMKGLVPDFKMWAREAQSGHILIGSAHEATAKVLGDLFEGKAPKHDTLLGPMYEVQAHELAKVAGADIGTMDGPDGKTYPAGTTFTSHDEITTKGDALQKLITKFSPHKTDPTIYKMAKVSGNGEEQKQQLTKALADVGLEAGEIKAGESYTMAPVKIADLEKVHTKETVYEPAIPEQPPAFASAPLPSLALKDSEKDRLPAENNRGDFSSAALGSLFLGRFGHKIRMGHAGILKDCQVAVRRVRDKDGGLYYQVSGELLDFGPAGMQKLQKGKVPFPTALTKVEDGHHVHNYDAVEDVHNEHGENSGNIQSVGGWVGVTENGSQIAIATDNRSVRDNFYVRIPVDKDVEAELHSAFSRMGVNADEAMAVPTPDDERLLLKAGVLRAGLGSARWGDEYDKRKLGNEEYLDQQIKKHSLEKHLKGARLETVFGGQQTVVLDDLDEITKRVPFALRTVHQLHHVWRNIIEGAGWASRKSQAENGIWAAGASEQEDWNVGGAIGTLVRGGFTHLDGHVWSNIGMHNPSAPTKVIFHPRIYQRADWWGNNGDSFGKPLDGPAGRYTRLGKNATQTNEQAFEGGISVRDVAGVVCEDPDDREKIVSELEKAGFVEVNGIPLDEFVVVGPKKSRSWIAKNLKGLKPGVLP